MDTGDRSKHVNVGVRDAGFAANTELRHEADLRAHFPSDGRIVRRTRHGSLQLAALLVRHLRNLKLIHATPCIPR